MENHQQSQQEMNAIDACGGLNLAPGFRFHPSDDEIVSIYLTSKVCNRDFNITAILTVVDLNNTEPWDLPQEAKMGDKEWCFFCQKDRKYPTGLRANRATKVGFWKATGKDKEVYSTKKGVVLLVGMKKTLVFYKGRAPRGNKTNWVMHEYRLEGSSWLPDVASASSSAMNAAAMKGSASKDEWVVCRVFDKATRIKKMTTPPYKVAMVGAEIDQYQSIPAVPVPMPPHLPMRMQFPILPDFAMHPMTPYITNAGMGMPPIMPSMEGISNAGGLKINNNAMFGNPISAPQEMNFYHQMDMGAIAGHMGMGATGQMDMGAASTSGLFDVGAPSLSSMVPQKDEEANAAEISSMMSIADPGSTPPP